MPMFPRILKSLLALNLLAAPMMTPAETPDQTPTQPAAQSPATAQPQSPSKAEPSKAVLFEQVRIFDGRAEQLTEPMWILVVGNRIEAISKAPLEPPEGAALTRIDGEGRTLMPGLIDAHTHVMYATLSQQTLLTSDIGFLNIAATRAAYDMLMRGFTSIRDLGGPVFGLKRGIDAGLVLGPRIWPAGAFISQSGGHGDFRLPNELPAAPSAFSYSEKVGAAVIADSPDAVRKRAREQLALGASQIKLMAGGGVASIYDPLDVTQYTVAELRAAVEAAENWGTYVTVHAYTPRAVRQAIEAGVQCIDHGQLLDEDTARLIAEHDLWWSLQPFIDDQPSPYPEGSANRVKQLAMYAGTDRAYRLAKQFDIKTAWGTDILFSAKNAPRQGHKLAVMERWFTPAEALRMATSGNAELLALSGPRSPYQGPLGVVETGALADLLLVDGNPLEDLSLVADAANNFLVIMKDGQIYKNSLAAD
ncbi:metal-dependent hydrolase family protein [Thiorhodovibrio frisius]|uniref:Amidohydrolase, imidazolonepropionase n=1 Tax=Thiorhodovibrio frisius TaxID=631362 RepID=H8Z883_9GAMM|nr:amidohydrolase family protein [Thiorhodovibrio frisius]EIC21032.1 amidohydrolase, imidazolonepropionase [Thiorhodovibrio frisius]WPL22088.1 imidazolonepropionase [Thiorhodovibrio frisius]